MSLPLTPLRPSSFTSPVTSPPQTPPLRNLSSQNTTSQGSTIVSDTPNRQTASADLLRGDEMNQELRQAIIARELEGRSFEGPLECFFGGHLNFDVNVDDTLKDAKKLWGWSKATERACYPDLVRYLNHAIRVTKLTPKYKKDFESILLSDLHFFVYDARIPSSFSESKADLKPDGLALRVMQFLENVSCEKDRLPLPWASGSTRGSTSKTSKRKENSQLKAKLKECLQSLQIIRSEIINSNEPTIPEHLLTQWDQTIEEVFLYDKASGTKYDQIGQATDVQVETSEETSSVPHSILNSQGSVSSEGPFSGEVPFRSRGPAYGGTLYSSEGNIGLTSTFGIRRSERIRSNKDKAVSSSTEANLTGSSSQQKTRRIIHDGKKTVWSSSQYHLNPALFNLFGGWSNVWEFIEVKRLDLKRLITQGGTYGFIEMKMRRSLFVTGLGYRQDTDELQLLLFDPSGFKITKAVRAQSREG
jgi:hypothetical protein